MIVDWQLIDWGQEDDNATVPASKQVFKPHEFNFDVMPRAMFVHDRAATLLADSIVHTFYVD